MDNYDKTKEMTDKIMDNVISHFNVEGDKNQIKVQIFPIISNGIYHQKNQILEEERLKTIMTLARCLDDENFIKSIEELKYTISIKKEK